MYGEKYGRFWKNDMFKKNNEQKNKNVINFITRDDLFYENL